MRKLTATASAIAFVASTLSTPAFAVIDATFGGTYPDLDLECDSLLKPGLESGFTTFALVHPSDPATSDTETSETVDTGIVSTVGLGTPTTTGNTFLSAHVHGQSPNIFAMGGLTVTYPAKRVTYSTQTTTTRTVVARCHVHKPTSGSVQDDDPLHPGYKIAPPGHNDDIVDSTTIVSVTTGTRFEDIQGPWVDPNASTTATDFVICISPGPSKGPAGGTWRTQNGYVNGTLGGTCSTEWYYQLQSINPIPSESLPPS